MFKNVIVKKPSQSMVAGITSAPELGQPNYQLALEQHAAYVAALKNCGVQVKVLESSEEFPDACFVEDTAVITSQGAILCNPGAASRNGEKDLMLPVLAEFFPADRIRQIVAPGTLDGGDVMMVGTHFYIGKSLRTNAEGIRQFIDILAEWQLTGSAVELTEVLHLKTGVNYLENNLLLAAGEFVEKPVFQNFDKIIVDPTEAYAANCIWVNNQVIVPAGYPQVKAAIAERGYEVIEVDTSEYRKLDGGLSCLSLRF